ncbi:MAG: two-component regulator propeller domain-containing protein [Chitinophagaceae bacterium]
MRLSCLLIYLILVQWASAQDPLRVLSTRNGLSQNAVTCIYQDKKGFLWVGTQDGLNRYDGYQFKHYKHNPEDSSSISDQFITAIAEDGKGELWIGTRHGLNRFNSNTEKFTHFFPDTSLKKAFQYAFTSLIKLDNGNLVMTSQNDLLCWDIESQSLYPIMRPKDLPTNFTVHRNKLIYGHQKGIAQLPIQPAKNSNILYQKNADLTSMYSDGRRIWMIVNTIADGYQVKLADGEQTNRTINSIQLNRRINHVGFDLQKNAWIATTKGLIVADSNGVLLKNQPAIPVNDEVLYTYASKEGIIWIGFANKGLGQYNTSSGLFEVIKPNGNDPVLCAHTDQEGNTWIGSSSGLYVQQKTSKLLKKISAESYSAITSDRDGFIWLGSKEWGLTKMSPQGKIIQKFTQQNSPLSANTIFQLHYNKYQNKLYISTIAGLNILQLNKLKWTLLLGKSTLTPDGLLTGNYFLQCFTDSKKITWVSNNGGLNGLDSSLNILYSFPSNTDQESFIKRTIVTGTCEDKQGNIWIATLSSGIYKFSNGKHRQYSIQNGLLSNVVYGVMSDTMDNIWIATSAGLHLLNSKTGHIRQFNEDNDLSARDFVLGSMQKEPNGNMLIASPEGLIRIKPNAYKEQKAIYQPYLTSASINYSPAGIYDRYTLSEQDKSISFEFAAPAFLHAAQIIYQYRFSGVSDQWITVTADQRQISFTNLPYQVSVLELRCASDPAQLNSAPVTRISIERIPPFWRRPVFILLCIALTIIGIVYFVRFITKQKLAQELKKAELKQTILKERERISRDLHDHLGAYAAAIKNNVVQLQKQHGDEPSLLQLKENADEMVQSLRETIWALQHEQISITSLSDRFKQLINKIAPNYPDKQIALSEKIETARLLSPNEGIQLLRIMQEALTNALRHAAATKINIVIESDSKLTVTVTDNGQGFDLHTQTSGYGLHNMRERAAEAGFQLLIKSTPKQGGTSIQISR